MPGCPRRGRGGDLRLALLRGAGAQALAGTGIRIATVINFPAGDEDSARAADDAAEACRDGAGEIDLVLPYRASCAGTRRWPGR